MTPFEVLAANSPSPKSGQNAGDSQKTATGGRGEQGTAFEDLMAETASGKPSRVGESTLVSTGKAPAEDVLVLQPPSEENLGDFAKGLAEETQPTAPMRRGEVAVPSAAQIEVGEVELEAGIASAELVRAEGPDIDPMLPVAQIHPLVGSERPSVENEVAAILPAPLDGEEAMAPQESERFLPKAGYATLVPVQTGAASSQVPAVTPLAAATRSEFVGAGVSVDAQKGTLSGPDTRKSVQLETPTAGAQERAQIPIAGQIQAVPGFTEESGSKDGGDVALPVRVESRTATSSSSAMPHVAPVLPEKSGSLSSMYPQAGISGSVEGLASGSFDTGISQEASGRELRSALSVASSSRTPAIVASAMPQLVAQITTGQAKVGSGEIEIRLDPPELGRVRISFSGVEGALTGLVVAERGEIDALMRRNAEQLADALAEAGFEDVTLQFGMREENGGTDFQQQSNDAARLPGVLTDVDLSASDDTALSGARQRTIDSGLDIRL